jgi:hypothetical protein
VLAARTTLGCDETIDLSPRRHISAAYALRLVGTFRSDAQGVVRCAAKSAKGKVIRATIKATRSGVVVARTFSARIYV